MTATRLPRPTSPQECPRRAGCCCPCEQGRSRDRARLRRWWRAPVLEKTDAGGGEKSRLIRFGRAYGPFSWRYQPPRRAGVRTARNTDRSRSIGSRVQRIRSFKQSQFGTIRRYQPSTGKYQDAPQGPIPSLFHLRRRREAGRMETLPSPTDSGRLFPNDTALRMRAVGLLKMRGTAHRCPKRAAASSPRYDDA